MINGKGAIIANEIKDIEAFARQIESLDIELSRNEEGVLTVCSTREPFFCFDGDTKDELISLVRDTLVSYGRHFYRLEGLDITTEDAPASSSIPVERTTPLGRLKPVFDQAA